MLKLLGAGGAVALAGCSQQSADGDGDGGSNGTTAGNGSDGGEQTTEVEMLGSKLMDPDGNQVTLSAVYSTGGSTTETTMQLIKQELGKVGINVELTGVPFNTMLSKYAQQTYEGGQPTFNAGPRDEAVSQEQWDLMGGIGFNSYPRTPTSIAPFWTDVSQTTQATVNFYGYKPTEPIGPKLDQASSETDEAARQDLLSNVFGILSRDQPVNFLTFSTDLEGFQQNVGGLNVGPTFGFDSQRWHFTGGSGSNPSVQGSFSTGSATDAKTLNPIRNNDTSTDARIGLTMDGAYALNNDDEFTPRWVQEYDTSDKQNYEFFLRDDLQWGADYGQMTADDWVYYIKEVHQAENNWAGDVNQSEWFRNEKPIAVQKTGNLSFEIQLEEVDPAFIKKPVMWGTYCMPKGLVEKYRGDDDGEGLNQDQEVQTLAYASGNLGPYKFDRWDRESVFVASRNDSYYGKNGLFEGNVPYFNQRSYQVFSEESTRLSAFKTGEITQTALPPAKATEYENNESTKVIKVPSAFCGMLVYNQRANGWEPLREQKVRQALTTGVNKQVIVEQINRGYAEPGFTHQPEYSAWFSDDKVTRFGYGETYGTALAQNMLADALPDGYSFE
ncbi:ABC transporter substrate-binding protein [Halomarina litorea]|uniref:ABC transporter substrate-binding protein n=1 Tax=Halomarina litorea TaxID=2961595 RepID=UPI0020C32D67|nr:ABC transporter substrate-binding protein [Halomarina sp. BCD28]